MGMSIEEYKKLILNEDEFKFKKVNRQIQGKINRGLGKEFENQVEAIGEIYRFNKLAIIEKTPEPMKILKHIDHGKFETVFQKSAQPDFKGVIKGGRTVVFDAKFTESDRIPYQALSDFQRETLLAYSELGAMAFVLVGFSDGGMYSIPIEDWANMRKLFGKKHLKQVELDEMDYKAKKDKNGMIDFLGIC